jgi:hypothetical protein
VDRKQWAAESRPPARSRRIWGKIELKMVGLKKILRAQLQEEKVKQVLDPSFAFSARDSMKERDCGTS